MFKGVKMVFRVLALIGITFAELPASAQQFEVVSIRPNTVDDINQRSVQSQLGGRIRFVGMPLSTFIMPAYDVWSFQILGGPSWIDNDGWDITAQAETVQGRLTREQLSPRLRAMLEDRFQLKTHRETRQLPAYSLVVDDRGPKLQPNTDGKVSNGSNSDTLNAKRVSMQWFAAFLIQKVRGTVVDETGLKGEYDFILHWSPESTQLSPSDDPFGSNYPSIFTAVREQLGLRLIKRTMPTNVLVIDSVQRPSPN
jgi:uncharacterized protein (TIGR03435 family)